MTSETKPTPAENAEPSMSEPKLPKGVEGFTCCAMQVAGEGWALRFNSKVIVFGAGDLAKQTVEALAHRINAYDELQAENAELRRECERLRAEVERLEHVTAAHAQNAMLANRAREELQEQLIQHQTRSKR